ncbi:hypothetical protein [Morganella morganii]|uniref:hypothetical protein n=1 Tax=Morganella morganii TaxID=582 RepID=UPI0013B3C63E|nr:hypothetical protein [Morganella morganii]
MSYNGTVCEARLTILREEQTDELHDEPSAKPKPTTQLGGSVYLFFFISHQQGGFFVRVNLLVELFFLGRVPMMSGFTARIIISAASRSVCCSAAASVSQMTQQEAV